MRKLSVAAVLIIWALATSALAHGAGELRISKTSRAEFPERSFILTLPRGVPLNQEAVRVVENGEPVSDLTITPASAVAGNHGTVLLIDTSESMKGAAIEAAMEAARVFAGHRKPGQKLAVVAYNADTRLLLPFTTDKARIDAALAQTPPVAYWTRMYDAVEEVVSLVSKEKLKSGAIVLLSDGQELGSASTFNAATGAARSADVRIFSVALLSRFFDSATLKSLASWTGGDYLEARSPNALVGIYDRLGYELANEYVVEYRSLAGAGEQVELTVTAAGIAGSAQARYVTPKLPTHAPPPYRPSQLDRVLQSTAAMIVVGLVVAWLLSFTAVSILRPRDSRIRERIGAFVSVGRGDAHKRPTALLSERVVSGTERSLERTRWWARFKELLEIADIRIPAAQVAVMTVIGTFLAVWLLSSVGSPAMGILGLCVPLAVRTEIKRRLTRKRRQFADQLPDNLQVLASALRAGHSLIGALSVVVDDSPEPSRGEFRRVVADERLGVEIEEALRTVATRMDNRDLEQVALAASLQRQTGGNTAEVLDRVTDTVRERAALRRLVRTLTAQGRMSRWVVSLLPVALLAAILAVNPDYLDPLWGRTVGQVMLVAAGLMVIAGSLVIKRIVNIEA